jgi:hypothetical protein
MYRYIFFFHIHTVHLDAIKVFYLPTDAQVNCLKNNFKIYIKIDIILTNVTLARSNNALPDDGDYTETRWSCFNVNSNVNFKTDLKTIHLCINW